MASVLSPESLPKGKVSRPLHGGHDALQRILAHLRTRRFNGYVKVFPAGDGQEKGLVLVRSGKVEGVLWDGPTVHLQGRAALQAIQAAAQDPATTLEVHGLPNPPKALAPEPPPPPEDRAWEGTIAAWRTEGFRTRAVEDLLGTPDARGSFEAFAARVDRCRVVLRALEGIAGPEAEELRRRALDPMDIESVEAALAALRSAPALALATPPPPAPSEPTTTPSATAVIPRMTFDTFVVGPSNQFALAAAMAVAKHPGEEYNPLVLHSGPGLGKTHLLHAIGNHVLSRDPSARVAYVPAETFANELRDATAENRLKEFRRRYRGLDLLLLDDLQFLGRDPAAQEEFLHTFNALHDASHQVVVASETLPRDATGLERRLVTRLEAGLVADLQTPDQETKVAILRSKARQRGTDLAAPVLQQVASFVRSNVRELEGLLNRLLAKASLLGRPVTEDLVREVAGDGVPSPATPPPPALVPGRAYLVEEERPREMVRLFADASRGSPALLVTRTNPPRLRETYPLDRARLVWLTDRPGLPPGEAMGPSLERLVSALEAFLMANPQGILGIDGLEYLVANNSFDAVLRFLRTLADQVATGKQVLLVGLNPGTLEPRELTNVEREMEVLRPSGR